MQTHPDFPSLVVLDHPLIQHKLTLLRQIDRSTNGFRRLLREISLLMGYEVTRDLKLTTKRIETPLEPMDAPILAGKKVAIVAILRAGLGMTEGLQELIPSARCGHIGLYRDPKTHEPVEYLVKLPAPEERMFILVDPMLATGNSAAHAVDVLNAHGVSDANIRFVALVAAPEGVRRLAADHPSVQVFTAGLDRELNEHAYILPGLGDAGDRIFGTK
ncbi:uracil phosphoribosyltransferase [Fodinicurvata sp. EGI_FJ10296]|uniref:uracil phosphoribosyltransferase n=1 Tax=Fodinicurvata sp. EGI_FJ10296 TaxID=3231908 RepID=UPI0034568EA9